MGSISCIGWLTGKVGAKFVLVYVATGATVGVIGTCIGGLIIVFLRWLTRVTTKTPTTATRKIASGDQPATDE